jgi:hypothetical protein
MNKKKKQPNDKEPKVTSEKPVTLNPLTLEQALEGLLKVKPKPKEKPKKKPRRREEKTQD